jgi:outer membrane protein assembly complex protein YaeT
VRPATALLAAALVAAALLAASPARAAPPVPAPPPPAPPRVADVELRLPAGEDVAAATALLAVEAGEPLSTQATRRTVQRLFQSGRFRNVVIRAYPAPAPGGEAGAWVRLVVEAQPLRHLVGLRVRVVGAGADEAAVRVAAGLASGAVFDDADLAVAEGKVRAALARRGYRDAQVDATAWGDRDVTVELVVAAGEPVRVGAVRLTGDPGVGQALAGRLSTRPGALLDDDVLAEDVRRLRAELQASGHRRARVSPPVVRVDGRTATVELPVEAGPRMVFLFRGNVEIPAPVLVRELGFEEGLPVDLPAVNAAVDRLLAFYRARGYAAARVEVREVRRGGDLAVVFHVDEGLRYRIEDVRVDGLSFREPAAVRARLAEILDEETQEPAALDADEARAIAIAHPDAPLPSTPPPALLPHEALDDGPWDRAAERLVDEWRAQGFLETLYLGASTSLDARSRTARVVLRFREGPRTFVDAIGFEGNVAVKLPELAREARLAPAAPLEEEKVEATRNAILRIYLSRGYLYARVEAREQLDRERHVAVVRFVIDEGPQVHVGRVLVTGNRHTRDPIVRRAVSLEEGDVYDPEAVNRSQAALLRLGVFQSVGLRVQDPEVPQETKDLAVELSERPWATLSQGVGFSIAQGPRAFLEWGQPNLFGRALELTARGKVNYPLTYFRPDLAQKTPAERFEGRTDIGLRAPGIPFVRIPGSVRGDLIGEILHRKAYDLRRASGVAGVETSVTSHVTASLQYELEVDRIVKTNAAQATLTGQEKADLKYPDGVTTLHAVRPTVTIDYRDNATYPHRGWLASSSVEVAHSLGTAGNRIFLGLLPGAEVHTNMLKVIVAGSTYFPVRATVLALSLRGGRVFSLDRDSQTIAPRRFFMGGANTMRGFNEEEMTPEDERSKLVAQASGGQRPVSVGGQAFVLGKAELRMPLRGNLEGALFTDLGNLWLDPHAARLQDLRANVGFGLRFITPIGPAALDVGFNVTPDERLNELLYAIHFTIGLF